jgi:hypothetical protein
MARKVRRARRDFSKFVHEVEIGGKVRYAVAVWDEQHGQGVRPFDSVEKRLTGASAEFARRIEAMQSCKNRAQARRRAEKLWPRSLAFRD